MTQYGHWALTGLTLVLAAYTQIAALVQTSRRGKAQENVDMKNLQIVQASAVITGYAQLCDDLQTEIIALNRRLRDKEAELARGIKEHQSDNDAHQAERDKWIAEKLELERQIAAIRIQKEALEQQLVVLAQAGVAREKLE